MYNKDLCSPSRCFFFCLVGRGNHIEGAGCIHSIINAQYGSDELPVIGKIHIIAFVPLIVYMAHTSLQVIQGALLLSDLQLKIG